MISKLQDVADGKIKRLMIFMPPGGAKSHYANVMFASWWIGANPGKKLITASYSQEVADKWGRRVRGIVKGEEYQETFDTSLSADSQAAGRWALSSDSEYYAVGVGGSVTSFRADLGVIDDPVKGREEAESDTIRDKTVEWYKSDFWTRLKPGAAVVLIMTRWHEEDLAGWLLEEAETGGEQWDILCLPMEAKEDDPLGRKPGDILWPEWFTPEMVRIAKRDQRTWSSLYQQEPTPEDGDFFKREWLRFYDELPKHLRVYGASDYAVTASGGDYTVHGLIGIDPDDNIYIIDWWRRQTDSLVWAQVLIDLIKQHSPIEWTEEAGPITKSIGPLIDKMQHEQSALCYRNAMPSIHSKPARAQAIRGRMAAGKVYFPKDAPWVADLISEMLSFPNGKHDDQVDVLGMFGRQIAGMVGANKPPEPAQSIQAAFKVPTFAEMEKAHDRAKYEDE